mgnify:CR=1 FL=1
MRGGALVIDLNARTAALRALWAARSVAVVGASDRPGALGRLPVEFLTRYGYAGRILPVRPGGGEVAGVAAYPSVAACPGPVDLAMIMVGAANVLAAVDDCVQAGVPVAIICTSGFAETGEVGEALQAEVVARARAGGLRILGPNCIGSVGVSTGQVSSFSPLFSGESTQLVPGGLGFVSQSGALGYGAVSLAFERGLGLGWVVNTGNEADVDAAEVMEAIAAEPGCTGILGYLESLDGRALSDLRRVVEAGTPIAVVKAGRSEAGAAAAASHTGALATGDRVVDAALRQFGIVRAEDVDELLDIGEAFASAARPRDRRVAIVTTSGGSGILAADALERHGLSLASFTTQTTAELDQIVPAYGSTANPVDVTASVMSDPALFDRALHAIAGDPGVDAIIACFCVLTGRDVDAVVSALSKVAGASGLPVLAVRTGADHLAPLALSRLRAAGIPCFLTPARAVRALAALAQIREAGERDLVGVPTVLVEPPGDHREGAVKAWLARHGLPSPAGRLLTAADEAVAMAARHGQIVLKAVVPGLVHKSDVGGVLLDVTPEGAPAAYAQVAALGGEVWAEEQVVGGIEALVGVAPSPLGPVVTVGVGGVLAEVMDDVALRIAPLSRADVEQMIDETRLGPLLSGVRGAPRCDRAALVEAVLTLCTLAVGIPEPFELDLNPIAVLPQGRGVRVLDAAYVPVPETHRGAE